MVFILVACCFMEIRRAADESPQVVRFLLFGTVYFFVIL